MNVVRDLVAQIIFHFRLNPVFIERINHIRVHPISAEKLTMALI